MHGKYIYDLYTFVQKIFTNLQSKIYIRYIFPTWKTQLAPFFSAAVVPVIEPCTKIDLHGVKRP